VNGYHRRLCAAELALARLSAGAPVSTLDALALRDPATLSDGECVDVWRHLAKLRIPPPPAASPQEYGAIVEAWRELTER
jgi:hypothetical protein